MSEVIRVACKTYRGDLAAVRKNFALSRAGQDVCIRLECAIPDTPVQDAIEVFVSRRDIYLIGLRNEHAGIKFVDSNPIIDNVDFTRTLSFSPNYSILGAWSEDFAYRGIWPFHNAIAKLAAVTKDSTFGPAESKALILVIFMVSEALRFWTLDKAVAEAICGTSLFRFVDWKDRVNNWDNLSKGDQSGALDGVILPSL
ncbi:ribosome-inactivating family protein [Pelagibius sp. Alg239-R121]|uniref:ribosome-inactivating family protein n=1 Tax=Pelagibius sp. Alg239-R121 TaxID=2993448 RepID=UPI0024A7205C|nr:ribosome-inactivating family protein [Pelagibius sp. Alg239-R121]